MKIKFLYFVIVLFVFGGDVIASDDTVQSKSKLSSPEYSLSTSTQSHESSIPDLKHSQFIELREGKHKVNDSFVARVTSKVSSACNPTSFLMAGPIIYYPIVAAGYAIPCFIGCVINCAQSAKQSDIPMTKGKKQQPSDKNKKGEKSPAAQFLKLGKEIDHQVAKLAQKIEKGIRYITQQVATSSSLSQKKEMDQKIKKQHVVDNDTENKKTQGPKLFGPQDSQDEIIMGNDTDQQPIILNIENDNISKPDLLAIRCHQWTKAILTALFTYGLLKVTDKVLRSGKLGIVGKKYVHYQNRYDVFRVRAANKGLSKIVGLLNKFIPKNAHIFYQYPA